MRAALDTRSLGLFVAVAEGLSFRHAAEALHMSQPPLSRAIRELEERLGTRLFERSTQHVALTASGERLLPLARRIQRLLAEAESAVRECRDLPTLRLGITSAAYLPWLDEVLSALQAHAPSTSIEHRFASSPQLVRLLRSHRLDAALIALPTEATGLDVVELDRMPMCVTLPSAHPLARKRSLDLADLNDQPLFWFERARQPAFFDHCERVFRHHAFSAKRKREPADQHVLLAEVAAGRALALMPSSLRALRQRGVAYRPLAQGAELSIGIGLATPPDATALRRVLMRALKGKLRHDAESTKM